MITVKFEGGDCLELSIETFVGAHLKGISFHRAIFEGLDFSGKMGSDHYSSGGALNVV
jgi:hypothetical protein